MKRTLMSVVTACVLASPAVAHAAALGTNLGFEAWDAATGRPEGWTPGKVIDGAIARECVEAPEGTCALRLQHGAARDAFSSLGQTLPASALGGHPVKLSGRIRTENVEGGWAGLWLRVDDVDNGMLHLQNMEKTGPRGTTGWQRFEISVPVAANSKQLVLGVLLKGGGTAWFDDLRLEVDEAVKVADVTRLAFVRPTPRAELEDLGELRLADDAIPEVKAQWREQARAQARPIRSLFSDDFSDLRFLAGVLEGKRVVQLGESSHGIAEFNWMKVRLIKYLHQELGFDVVAFESSLTGCDAAQQQVGRAAAVDVMRQCIFPVWHTSETLGLFEYLDAAHRSGRPLALAGFDVQNSGNGARETARRFQALLEAVDSPLAASLAANEARLRNQMPGEEAAQLTAFYSQVLDTLGERREALRAGHPRPVEVDLAIQEARSRVAFVRQLAQADVRKRTAARDRGMADNLDFLLDRLHPGRKVIVWAHNSHIAKRHPGREQPDTMGAWVAQRRGDEVYTIGVFMGRGVGTTNVRKQYAIAPPPPDSLEAVMASAGYRMSFADLRLSAPGDAPAWMRTPVVAREWGVTPARIIPAETYDGVIYIDTVTPPQYR